jgi:hypothetical protein
MPCRRAGLGCGFGGPDRGEGPRTGFTLPEGGAHEDYSPPQG